MSNDPTATPATPPQPWLLPALAVVVGVLGMCAVWTAAAVFSRSTQGWLAMLAAMDMVFLMRLAGSPPGMPRMVAAVLATAATVAMSYWMIVASEFGLLLGLQPLDSAQRMGSVLAWELTRLITSPWDLAFALASLPLAAWWGRTWR